MLRLWQPALLAATFLFGTLLAVPAPSRADDAAALLAKHKAFVGWQFGDTTLASYDETETIGKKDEAPLYVRHTRRRGAIFRSDTHSVKANIDYSNGYTGRVFWYADQNGFTVPVIGTPAHILLARDLLFVDGFAQLPWTITGTKRMWDKLYTVVRVHQDFAGDVDLYVDPQTGAYGGITIDPKGDNEETIHILAYSEAAPGKNLIAKWQYEDSTSVHTLAPTNLAATVSDDDLHPPAPSAHWDFLSAQPFKIELTRYRIIVKAKVNGVEGKFLLDSGAADIFLSGAFARRAGLTPLGHAGSRTLYGAEKNDIGKVATFEMGGNRLTDLIVYYGSGEFDSTAPDGLIGFSLFAASFVTVDFEHSTMSIEDPAKVDMAKVPGVRVGVDLSTGQPVTPMSVQGNTVVVNALLDTGSPTVILIDPRLAPKYGLHLTGVGVNGIGCGLLDDMTLGPIVYQNPNACMNGTFGLHGALLGYDFLKGLAKMHFDYSRAFLILLPRQY